MREGMVLEVNRDHVVVLTKGGEYLKLRKSGNINIGDIYSGKPYFKFPYYYAAAAVMLIIISSYTGITAYANQIVGYVDINGDKDIRLYVNRKGTVQKTEGLDNPDTFKNLTIESAAEEINKISDKEKIFEDSSKVEISAKEIKSSGVNLDKEKDKLEKALLNKNKEKNKDKDKDNKIKGNNGNIKDNNKNSTGVNKSAEEEKNFEKNNSNKNANENSKNTNKNKK